MTTRKPPTIRDVAAHAGVSIATVSKLVNGQQNFSPEVRAKVRDAIAALGYSRNPAARSMVTGRTQSVGLAVMDIANPYYAHVVKGANRVALSHGYDLLVVDLEESIDTVRGLLDALARRTDGLIVSSRIPGPEIDRLVREDRPVVFIGQPGQNSTGLSVGMDSASVARLLAGYFVQQGFARVGYLGFERAQWNADRIRGLKDVFDPAGVSLQLFDAGGPTSEAGEQSAARVLLIPDRPEAVICWNDQVAIGFMAQARELGFSVPEDLAVAGIDNIATGRYVTPGLTTVDTQPEKTGEALVRQVLARIEGRETEASFWLQPHLVIRDSARNLRRGRPGQAQLTTKSP